MKFLIFAFGMVFSFGDVSAQATGWQPSPGHTQTEIWPGTPPDATAVAPAEDDNVDGVKQSLVYYIELKNAGVPAEMHLYAHGGHAFGLRRTELPITAWPQFVETWLETIGMIPKQSP